MNIQKLTGNSEAQIERYLVRTVRLKNGLALKLAPAGWTGVPDRLVMLPGGKVCFVELKAPGLRPRPIQVKRHDMLRELGFDVHVIDSTESVDNLMREVSGEV